MHNEAFKLGKEVSYRLGIVITIWTNAKWELWPQQWRLIRHPHLERYLRSPERGPCLAVACPFALSFRSSSTPAMCEALSTVQRSAAPSEAPDLNEENDTYKRSNTGQTLISQKALGKQKRQRSLLGAGWGKAEDTAGLEGQYVEKRKPVGKRWTVTQKSHSHGQQWDTAGTGDPWGKGAMVQGKNIIK